MFHPTRAHFPPFLGERMQLGFVTPHLDDILPFWTETMKVGPFVVIEDSLGDRQFLHRGQDSPVRMSIAFCYLGDLQIEVITQSNRAPSPYTEFIDSGRQGLHHVAFWPEDTEGACRELERTGFKEVCRIQARDGQGIPVRYYDSPPHLGVMLEIAPMRPDRVQMFGAIKALAHQWDGSRPIRRFRTRADFLASDDCKAA